MRRCANGVVLPGYTFGADFFNMDRPAIPLISLLSGLFMSGGGQLYNRQPVKALIFWLLFWVGFTQLGPIAFVVTAAGCLEALLVALGAAGDER